MTPQLKAKASQELVDKADAAGKVAEISRAELIRRAVDEKADEILQEFSRPSQPTDDGGEKALSDGTGLQTENTDTDDDSEGYNYLKEYAEEVDSLENLGEIIPDEIEYPVDPDQDDVDWTDTDVVGGSYNYRLPVVRAFAEHECADEEHVPDAYLREWITETLNMTRATMYNDFNRMIDEGCLYPNLRVDPKWDEEAVRQDLLDHICSTTNRDREEFSQKKDSVEDLLREKVKDDGEEELVYGERFADVWFFEREDWKDHLEHQLDRLTDVVIDDRDSVPYDVDRYEITLEHYLDFLEERGIALGWKVRGVRRQLEDLKEGR